MPSIGLLVTGDNAIRDFGIFLHTLKIWHPSATLFLYTDTPTLPAIQTLILTVPRMKVYIKTVLNAYTGLTRSDMEAQSGFVYDTLFKDYTYEKAAVIDWMFATLGKTDGIWFMDADIAFCAPLPSIPTGTRLALSPHYIREADCRLYGRYNAGFLWLRDPALVEIWRNAGTRSRFFEQAALEELAETVGSDGVYEFPPQINFGWWRMYQGVEAPSDIQTKFSIHRGDTSIGIRYNNIPLQSIHTHWHENTSVTGAFNRWFLTFLTRISDRHPVAHTFHSALLKSIW